MATINVTELFKQKQLTDPVVRLSFTNYWPLNSITLENVVTGSSYFIRRRSTGEEIASGTASSSTVETAALPWFENFLFDVYVRKASSGTKYLPFQSSGTFTANGASVFVSQIEDGIIS